MAFYVEITDRHPACRGKAIYGPFATPAEAEAWLVREQQLAAEILTDPAMVEYAIVENRETPWWRKTPGT